MPLDYRLSPDSPLLRGGAFKRMTSRSLWVNSFDRELQIDPASSFNDYLLSLGDPEEPVTFSLMQADEFLALLSFPGITWFVSNKVPLDSKQAALTILTGMPWPLWTSEERQGILLNVSMAQAAFLKKMFAPTDGLLSILVSLSVDLPHSSQCNPQEGQDTSGFPSTGMEHTGDLMSSWPEVRMNQTCLDNVWRSIARTTNQDVMVIRHVARALRTYLHYLVMYLLQCMYSTLKERDRT